MAQARHAADDRRHPHLVDSLDHHDSRKRRRHDVDDPITRAARRTAPDGLVEMAWDPITRIVGSLGIYTKIDFNQQGRRRVPQHQLDLPRLLDLHEGQGPARRALHHQPDLRHLR